MKYNTNWLVSEKQVDFLFFWGHQPAKDGSIIKTCMSQWWSADFEENGARYQTAEHYMMAGKAKLFGDQEVFEKILSSDSPKDVKELGRQIRNFDVDLWNAEKYNIVKQGNLLKFAQNKPLRDFLLETGNKVLVEASPVDFIWGNGLKEEDPCSFNVKEWKGENLLGFALMEVRDELIK